MEINETQLRFETAHPVYTLNHLTDQTSTIWIACHGYGQLARYFVKRFDVLSPTENFIIAPQGLSRYYLDGDSGRVGASWMTRENRDLDLANQRRYFDRVFDQLLDNVDWTSYRLKLFGFSQGVTMISRLVVYKRLQFDQLILWAGGMPHEQTLHDWAFVDSQASIDLVIGEQDQYFDQTTVNDQIKRVQELTGIEPKLTLFAGKHEVKREVLKQVIDARQQP